MIRGNGLSDRSFARGATVGNGIGLAVLLLAAALTAQSAHAQTLTWNPTGNGSGFSDSSGTWDAISTNWWNGAATAWASGSNAQFSSGSGGTTPYTVTVSGSQSVGGIIFQNQAYTLSGGTLNLVGVTPTITVNAAGGTIGSIFTGSADLTKVGAGALTLTGSNIYTGSTTVTAGTLTVAGGGAVNQSSNVITQNGILNVSGGSVTVGNGAVFGVAYDVTGSTGAVVVGAGGVLNIGNGGGRTFVGGSNNDGKNGNGTLTINAGGLVNCAAPGAFPNERIYLAGYGGNGVINLSGGTLATARDICLGGSGGTVAFNGGTLLAAPGYTVNSGILTSGVTVYLQAGGGTINSNGFNITASANLLNSGGGGLTKVGVGTLTLSGNNTFTGGATISDGTLLASNGNSLGSGTATLNGGTLAVASGITLSNNIFSPAATASSIIFQGNSQSNLNGSLTGSGTVNFTSNATALITPAMPNVSSFTGTIGIDTSPAGNIFFPSVSSGASANWVITGGGAGSGAGSGSFVYSGATAVSLGALSGNGRVGAANANTTWSVGALNTSTTFSGVIINNYFGGTAALTKVGSGMLTLTGNNAYSGATTVSAGTLAVGPTGTIFANGGVTVNGAGSVLNVSGSCLQAGGATNFAIQNNGVVNFSGTESVGGANTGAFFVGFGSAGTLNMTGGSLAVNYANTNGFGIGWTNGTAGTGAFNISGGTCTLSNADVCLVGMGNAASQGQVNVSGNGVLNLGGGGGRVFFGGDTNGSGNYGTGSLTIGGSGLVNVGAPGAFPAESLYLAAYGGTGSLNLNGGTLTTARPIKTGGNSTINFNGGTLVATAPSAGLIAITTANVLDGGLTFNDNGNNVTIAQPLLAGGTGIGGLVKLGPGTTTLSGLNTYGGGTTISAGMLQGANNSGFGTGAVTVNGGTLGLIGPVAVANSVVLTANNANAIAASGAGLLSGNISGPGGLTVAGTGVLNLTGSNTYLGPTTVSSGTLRLPVSGTLPAGTKIMPVGDSITYGVNGTNAGYRSFLYNNLGGATGGFQFVGTTNGNPGGLPTTPVNQTYHDGWGGWTTGDVLGNYQGPSNNGTSGNIGTWLTQLSGSGALPTVITLMIGTNDSTVGGWSVSQGTSNLSAIIDTIYADDPGVKLLLGQVTPRLDNPSAAAWNSSYNAAMPAIVAQKVAAGDNVVLVNMNTNFPANGLSGDNLHPNDTGYAWIAGQWAAAMLSSATSNTTALPANSPTTVAAGATLDLAGNMAQVGPLSGAGTVTLGGGFLTVNSTSGSTSTFAGTISGAGTVKKTGPAMLMLTGNNTYTGATIVNAGALALGVGGSIASSTVAINGGATFDASAVPGGYTVPAGQTITGVGTASVSSTDALTLSAGAALSAGSNGVGTLTIGGGSLTLNGGSSLNFGASGPGTNSLLNIPGTLNLAGSGIGVNLYQAGTNSYFQTDGSYTLATYGSLAGSLSNLATSSDFSKLYSFGASGGSLTLTIADGGTVWTGNAGTNWSSSGNWSSLAAPVNGQAVVFAGTNSANTNDITGLHVNGVQFNAGAATFNLTGNSIQLIRGIQNFSVNPQTLSLGVVLGANLPVNAAAGPITIAAPMSDGGAGYGIALTGTNVVTLTAANTFSGTTTISAGTLQVGSGAANGSLAGNIVNNSALVLAPATTVTLNGAISGPGAVTQIGPGAAVLAGTNSYTGPTLVSGGTLTIGPNSALASSAGMTVAGNGAVLNMAGAYGGGGVIQANSGGLISFAGAAFLSGSAAVVIGGGSGGTLNVASGNLSLAATSASTAVPASTSGMRIGDGLGGAGVLNVNGGAVATSAGDEFLVGYNGATGAVNVSSSGVLNIGGGGGRIFIGGGDNGGNAGSGTLNVNGGGTVVVAPAGAFPNEALYLAGYGGSGVINLNGGLLSTARGINNGGNSTFNFNGGTLQAAASIGSLVAVTNAYVLAGGGTIDTQGYNATIGQALLDGGGGGGLTKIGDGDLVLTGQSTFTGGTTVNGGTLTLQHNQGYTLAASTSVTVNNGATLQLARTNPLGYTTSVPTININGGTLTATSGNFNVAHINNVNMQGGVWTTDSTVGVFNNENYSFYGTLTISGTAPSLINPLYALALEPIPQYGPNNFLVNPTGGRGPDLTVACVIQDESGGADGSCGILKTGNGEMLLSGSNTYSGGTDINAGILQFANTAATPANGSIAVAGSAILAVNAGGASEFSGGTAGAGSIGGLLAGVGGQGAPVTWQSGAILGIDSTNAAGGLTYAGSIADTGSGPLGLAALSGGTLTLAGTNTYTGGTDVLNGATLIVTSPSALDANGVGTNLAVGSVNLLADFGTYFSPTTPASPTSVPEPAPWDLLAAGVGGLAFRRLRSRRGDC
jgi:autotransporter-associated beta strand protein